MSRRDIYAEVTDRIAAALETGVAPWARPWAALGESRNLVTGRPYSGVNTLLLGLVEDVRGYPSRQWGTFKQIQAAGGAVKKGEKATQVVFFSVYEKERDGETERIPVARSFAVFNRAQTTLEEAPPPAPPTARECPATAAAARLGVRIEVKGDAAAYRKSDDAVLMPAARFESPAARTATLFHELVHWTGAPGRLNRDLSGRFGTEAYAAEELVAELGSAFLCARHGVDGTLRHAEYLGHWAKVLRADKRAIFTASSAARKAADLVSPPAAAEGEEEAA